MNRSIDILLQLAETQHGRITTKDVVIHGFRREMLGDMVEEGLLIREARGMYRLPDTAPDFYLILRHSCPKAVFSYETALWFHSLLVDQPDKISITVQQGSNISRLKNNCPNLTVHYVQPDFLEFGMVHIPSPITGSNVNLRAYDPERCICDLIRSHLSSVRDQTDSRIYTQALKNYFKSTQKNLQRLQQYAHRFSMEEEVYRYMEFLM